MLLLKTVSCKILRLNAGLLGRSAVVGICQAQGLES